MSRAATSAPGTSLEFFYRLPGRPGGRRPGAHASRSVGPGSAFAAHGRLFDRPDPRRLDLRASLASAPREWLVRVNHQRSAARLHAIVDVSASMHFGAGRGKLGVASDVAGSIGRSAFRNGDAAGLSVFDAVPRDDVGVPARAGRGVGEAMAGAIEGLRDEPPRAGDGTALVGCASRVGGAALVFVVSDFHFAIEDLEAAIESLATARVIPLVVRDPAELAPPDGRGWLDLIDAESGRRRPLWLRERTRRAWRENVARREAELDALFASLDIRPLRLVGAFEPDALTRHFAEAVA